MEIELEFGKIKVNGKEYNKDIIIFSDGKIEFRPKEISKSKKEKYGHTPLTKEELETVIKEDYDYILIGTGIYEYLPIEKEAIDFLKEKAKYIIIGKSKDIIDMLNKIEGKYLAIIHITC